MSDQNNSTFTELPEDDGLYIDAIFGPGSSADAPLPPVVETTAPAADNETSSPESTDSPANTDTPANTDSSTLDSAAQTQNTAPADSPQEPSVDASPKDRPESMDNAEAENAETGTSPADTENAGTDAADDTDAASKAPAEAVTREAPQPVEPAPDAKKPAKGTRKGRSKTAAASANGDAGEKVVDLFSAFNGGEADAPLSPSADAAPDASNNASQSIFDRPPVFVYGGAEEKISDASVTFEELRIQKADDFPELAEGKTVSWRVKYGSTVKTISNPKGQTIASVKEEIEKSKSFLDGLRKAKDKNPDCQVTPTITAKSKGIAAYKGVFPTVEAAAASDKIICLIPARDGRTYEMRKSELGQFVAPKDNIVDFAEVRAGFVPALPRIPRELMGQIVSFFRCFMNEQENYEALVLLYWDRQQEEFVPFIPRQTATSVRVHADLADNCLADEDRYLLYADIHSHNRMAAKFSETDNRDEKATRLYMVLGNLHHFYPDITARVSCGGTYLEIDAELVVDGIGEEFPTEWLDQVERKRPLILPGDTIYRDLVKKWGDEE